MYKFIKENDVMHLLEQRIHNGNMRNYLEENPDITRAVGRGTPVSGTLPALFRGSSSSAQATTHWPVRPTFGGLSSLDRRRQLRKSTWHCPPERTKCVDVPTY
jgi:hypothetical protein